MKVVVVDKIHKQYHDHVIFDDFSMEIEQGSFVAIQGASGSGKSTLLNMIGLLDSPDKGNIVIFDKKNVKPFSNIFTLFFTITLFTLAIPKVASACIVAPSSISMK